MAERTRKRALTPLREFIHAESAGGIALVAAAVAALAVANSPAAGAYASFWEHKIGVGSVTQDLRHWVNDGLMTLFFFVAGLEIKRELVVGELRDRRAALLPVVAGVAGVLLPALLYLLVVTAAGGDGTRGWAVPIATDIAFAVGILTLLGRHASSGAKLFLLSVAIVDDIIAIAIIGVVYADKGELWWLAAAAGGLLAEAGLRWLGVSSPWAYVPAGVLMWLALLESGVHATLAGVALGLLTPAHPVRGRDVLDDLQHALHPVSVFLVVPAFVLANAGVDLRGGRLADAFTQPITWAVIVGLVLGKVAGITGAAHFVLRRGWGALPADTHPAEIIGVAALGGIGFTVSMLITDLAFPDPVRAVHANVGIFAASLTAAAIGIARLRAAPVRTDEAGRPDEPDGSGESG